MRFCHTLHYLLSWQGNWNVPNSRGQNAFRERSERAAASAQFTSVGCRSVSCSTAEVCWRRERGARDASAGSPQCSLLRSRAAAHHHADRQRDNSGGRTGLRDRQGPLSVSPSTAPEPFPERSEQHGPEHVPVTFRTHTICRSCQLRAGPVCPERPPAARPRPRLPRAPDLGLSKALMPVHLGGPAPIRPAYRWAPDLPDHPRSPTDHHLRLSVREGAGRGVSG